MPPGRRPIAHEDAEGVALTAQIAVRKLIAELRAARKKLGLTQREVGTITGAGNDVINRLEIGKAPNPTILTLFRFADAVGMDLTLQLSTRTATR